MFGYIKVRYPKLVWQSGQSSRPNLTLQHLNFQSLLTRTFSPQYPHKLILITKTRTMATSQQLQLTQLGGPMEVVSVPRPTPAADQVLIRVGAVALNALDWKQRDVGMLVPRYPHVLGVEGAGVVEAVGADVTGLGVGDEVAAWMAGASHGMPWGAAYQTHVVVPAQFVAKKPKGISLAEAASLPYVDSPDCWFAGEAEQCVG